MTRFSTSLDVSEELDDVEESSEELNAGKPEAAKSKTGRDYAQEFEVYDREENMDDEMDELDSDFNGGSKVKTVSNGWAKKAAAGREDADEDAGLNADKESDEESSENEKNTESVVEEYNVKQKAEFTDVDEVAEPKKKSLKGNGKSNNGKGSIRKETNYSGNGKGNGGNGKKGNNNGNGNGKWDGGNGKRNNGYDAPDAKASWLWAAILIILIIGAGAAGYILFKNARQHAVETNLSGFSEQIATDLELTKQSIGENLNMSVAELNESNEISSAQAEANESAANETIAEPVLPAVNETVANETIVNETTTNETTNETTPAPEDNTTDLKDVLIQGLS